jgi:Sap, sulfolipid-1-addressing protein
VNPKNLIMAAGAGVAIGSAALDLRGDAAAVAVFTVIAASTVPVFGCFVAAERMRGPLDSLKGWLQDNNATVMATLILVIGAVLVGKGVSGL